MTKRNSFAAALLSACVPGLGQLYKGHLVIAIVWFLFISGLYCLVSIIWPLFPGAIMAHLICILHAFLMD